MPGTEPLMELRTEARGSVAVVTVTGECDMSESPRLAETLRDVATHASEVHVVLSGLMFLDSSTLQVLHRASAELAAKRARLVLVAPTPAIRRVLQIARLDTHFEIRETLEAWAVEGDEKPPAGAANGNGRVPRRLSALGEGAVG